MDKRHVTACTLDCLHKSQLLNTTTFGGGGGDLHTKQGTSDKNQNLNNFSQPKELYNQ